MKYLFLFISISFFAFHSKGQSITKTPKIYLSDTLYTIIEQQGKPPRLSNTIQMILDEGSSLGSFMMKSSIKSHSRYFVMIARIKGDAEILTLTQLYDRYHISPSDRALPVSTDKADFVYSTNVIIIKSAVISVKVDKRKNTGKPYINITTTNKSNDIG